MDYAINTLDSVFKDPKLLEITNLHKVKRSGKSGPGLDHLLPFGHLPGGSPDTDAPFEETIDDMGANEACGSRHQDIVPVDC